MSIYSYIQSYSEDYTCSSHYSFKEYNIYICARSYISFNQHQEKKKLNDAYFPCKCTSRQIKSNYCKIPVPEKRRKYPSTLPTLRPIWNHMQLRHRKI